MFAARYPGRCARTGAQIAPGDTIASAGRGRYYLVTRAAPAASEETVDPDGALGASVDETLDPQDEATIAAGRYLRRSLERGVSHVWSSGGRELYRNKRGRCEDAPCCGCCNV
jgi:hypothetical protein